MPTDIPNSSSKIQQESVQFRSAVSENTNSKIGGAINYLLDQAASFQDQLDAIQLNIEQFLTPGDDTWTAPDNLYNNIAIIFACGGGGGGAGANAVTQQGGQGANTGIKIRNNIVNGDTYNLHVGGGGAGGSGANTNGTDGGDSSFDGVVVGQGGRGGKFGATAKTTTMLGLNDTHGAALRNGNGGGLGSAGDDSDFSPGGLGDAPGGKSGKSGSAAGTAGTNGFLYILWLEKQL